MNITKSETSPLKIKIGLRFSFLSSGWSGWLTGHKTPCYLPGWGGGGGDLGRGRRGG